jgi:hypothetical protein
MATSMKSSHVQGHASQEQSLAELLAHETEISVELVREIYEQERSALANDAKITQYLDVLTTRRVRMRLREH